MFRSTLMRVLPAGAALLVLAACEEAAAPSLSDPAAISAEVAAADEAFQSAPVQSFSELGDLMDGAVNPAAARVGAVLGALSPQADWTGAKPTVLSAVRARDLQAVAAQLGARAPQDSFLPDAVLGTYEWDTGTDQYVLTSRPGAPANTVRFILYAISPIDHLPVEPLNEVGSVDFTDNQPAGQALSLSITVISGSITYLSYTGTITWSARDFTASAVGYVSNGQQGAALRRLDFDVDVAVTGTETSGTVSADALFDLNVPDVQIEVHDDATLSGNTITFTRDFHFHRPGEEIRVVGTISITETAPDTFSISLDVTVHVNGDVFARIEGTGEAIVATGPGGRSLTQAEQLALLAILEASHDFWEHVVDFFEPVADLTA